MEEYIAQTVEGIEDIAAKEIKEITGGKAEKVIEGRLKFNGNNLKKLIYVTRSIDKIYKLLLQFKFESLDEIEAEAKTLKLEFKETFAVRCQRSGEHPFTSKDVEIAIGNTIEGKVDLNNPETTVFADIVGNECFIGIDMTIKPLHRREYRVRANHQSVNPCVAYAMIRMSDWKEDEILLDPFCKDGVIPVEAAMFASNIPRGYYQQDLKVAEADKEIKNEKLNIFALDSLMCNVRSTEVNAKLAGVNKLITYSKAGLDWLDVKFKESSVGKIVTFMPSGEDRDVEKIYREFFHQVSYITKKKGKAVLATFRPEIVMRNMEGFELKQDRLVKIGGFSYTILVLDKV